MNDQQANIFKAFIAALTQLNDPLPPQVQQQLKTIAQTGEISRLSGVAKQHKPLEIAYKQARNWLVEHSNQQRKGLDFLPDATWEKENPDNTEIDNASGDISDLPSLPDVLQTIKEQFDKETLETNISRLLDTEDSVQSAKRFLYPDIPMI